MMKKHMVLVLAAVIMMAGCAKNAVDPAVPATPVLTYPPDGYAFYGAERACFEWQFAVSHDPACRLQVSRNPAFTSMVADTAIAGWYSATNCSLALPDTGITYYWRVSASDAAGNGEWSDIRSFSVPYRSFLVDTITVADHPGAMTFLNASQLWVGDTSDARISVISPSLGTVAATSTPGAYDLTASPDGQYVYLITKGYMQPLLVLRTSDMALVDTILNVGPINGPFIPNLVAFTPAGDKAYICRMYQNRVLVMRTSDHTLIDSVNISDGMVGGAVHGIAAGISGSDTLIYVATGSAGLIKVIKAGPDTVVATLRAPGLTVQTLVSAPGWGRIFAPAPLSWLAAGGSAFDLIDQGKEGGNLAVSRNGDYLYVAAPRWPGLFNDIRLYIYRTSDMKLMATPRLPCQPTGMIYAPNEDFLYISDGDGHVYKARGLN